MDNTNNNADVFCANCGAKMPAGTKFCISCGKPVGGPAAPNPNMTQQTAYATQAAPMPKTKIGITVGLFAAAIYFAAIFGGYVRSVYELANIDEMSKELQKKMRGLSVFQLRQLQF